MPKLPLNTINNSMYGSTQLTAVYSGSTKVWPTNLVPMSSKPINLVYVEDPVYITIGSETYPSSQKGWMYWAPMLPPNNGSSAKPSYMQNGYDASGMDLNGAPGHNSFNGNWIYETVNGVDYQLLWSCFAVRGSTGYQIQIRGAPVNRTDYTVWSPWTRILDDGTSPEGEEPFTTDLLPQDIVNYNPDTWSPST